MQIAAHNRAISQRRDICPAPTSAMIASDKQSQKLMRAVPTIICEKAPDRRKDSYGSSWALE
jgi:hypothetical protein